MQTLVELPPTASSVIGVTENAADYFPKNTSIRLVFPWHPPVAGANPGRRMHRYLRGPSFGLGGLLGWPFTVPRPASLPMPCVSPGSSREARRFSRWMAS